ncbi:amidohydrolase family protein [bacterium]|nr:amidohydrolase family protein [bacterium]
MIIKARYALVAPGDLRRDVQLETDGNRILSISEGYVHGAPPCDIDLGDAVLTPGFTNSHAHLELEFCQGQTSFNGSFVDWLQHVRDLKKQRGNQLSTFPLDSIRQLAMSGCTTVFDHHTVDLEWDRIELTGLRHIPLLECFEFNNDDPDGERIRKRARFGYAPHAPYTASLAVARTCRRLATEAHVPLSVHMSEFNGEIEFIRNGQDSEIQHLHELAGTSNEHFSGTGMSPVQFYGDNGILDEHTLAIHVNYLSDGDIAVLQRMHPTVVYCPRSHAYFGHPQHPLLELLDAGINVALGTDSLASNDMLSPLHEASLVRDNFPGLPLQALFSMVTRNGLAVINAQHELGSLCTSYIADLAAFRIPEDTADDFDSVFGAVLDNGRSCLTICNGRIIHIEVSAGVQVHG